jgi:ARG and Rhodanese-Phosphatase-superfamily-associated Protein domain
MERPLLTVVAISLLGLTSTLGGLAFVWAAPGARIPPPSRPEGGWRLLDPVVYENISIFPVVSSSAQDTSYFLTLDEGLSSGEVLVSEQGAAGLARTRGNVYTAPPPQYASGASVNQLVLINRGKRPLILLAGELVSGGKQDRIIAKDRIVAPGSDPLPLDVFCVEHGRWSSGSQFAASKVIVHPSVREQAAVKRSQTDVWAAVTSGTTAAAPAPSAAGSAGGVLASPRIAADALSETLRREAPTQSYNKIYTSHRVGGSIDALVDALQRRFARATSGLKGERVVGVVIAYGGEVAWSDIFASADLFDQYWPKLLRSYAVEALARPTLRETASADDAREFLRRLTGRETQETEPGVYRVREITEGPLSLIELDSLQPKLITLHRLLLHRTS